MQRWMCGYWGLWIQDVAIDNKNIFNHGHTHLSFDARRSGLVINVNTHYSK